MLLEHYSLNKLLSIRIIHNKWLWLVPITEAEGGVTTRTSAVAMTRKVEHVPAHGHHRDEDHAAGRRRRPHVKRLTKKYFQKIIQVQVD